MQKFAQISAEIVKLDKGFPLISVENGAKIRAEFNNFLSKNHIAVAVGDKVRVSVPAEGDEPSIEIRDQGLGELGNRDQGLGNSSDSQSAAPTNPYSLVPNPSYGDDPCIIEEILPRETVLFRNDPVNRRKPQVLAANFDQIAICVAANQLNFNHLARMLVIACSAGVPVALIVTKCDLGEPEIASIEPLMKAIDNSICTSFVGNRDQGLGNSSDSQSGAPTNPYSLVPNPSSDSSPTNPFERWSEKTTVLLGKSGVGKSTLINALAGREVCKQGEVREFDSKGRHTTVSREIIETEHFGRIVDMPGVRSLGLINCQRGLETVFSSIYNLAQGCKFRDCKHTGEPGCAVVGNVSDQLLSAYHKLCAENASNS